MTEPPIPVSGESADDVVAAVSARIPMSDVERACFTRRLSDDPALRNRVRAGVSPGSEDFGALLRVAHQCSVSETFAPLFADNVNDSHGGSLSAEQKDCLRSGLSSLTDDQLDLLVDAGVNPGGTSRAAGETTVSSLVARCGA